MRTRIKEVRKEKGLTQQKFADALGLSRAFIAQIECGAENPSDRTVSDICRIFNVDEAWLRTGDGEMFVNSDPDEDVVSFCAELLKTEKDEVTYRFIKALSMLSPDEWKVIDKLIDSMNKTQDNKNDND